MKYRLLAVVIMLVGTILLTGCATTTKQQIDIYKKQQPALIYQAGIVKLKNRSYTNAITAFQSLNAQYPFNPYTQKGDLGLIYSYFEASEPALALAIAQRFIKVYPTNPDAAYAYYMTGLIDFDNGRGILQRRLPYKMAEHNIISYRAAYQSFSNLIRLYPHSQYVPDAKRRMAYLNQVMAKYELDIATFYLDRVAYVTAANRAQQVLVQYPNAATVKPALLIMLRAYHHLNLPNLTDQTAKLIQANYPHDKEFIKLQAAWKLHL